MIAESPRALLIGFGLMIVLFVGALLGINAWHEYRRELQVFEERLAMEVRLLAEHARLSLTAADLMLDQAQAKVRDRGLDALASDPDYWQSLRDSLQRMPELQSLILIDTEGAVRLTTHSFPAPDGLQVDDRPYFQTHRNGAPYHIGVPIRERSSHHPLIPVSRRLEHPDSTFQGVVAIGLNVRHFQEFYRGEPESLERQITVYRQTGELLLRYPNLPPDPSPSPGVLEQFAGHSMARFISSSPMDGVEKIIVYQRLDDYPLVVAIGMHHDALLASLVPGWRRSALVFLVFTGATILIITLLARALLTAAHMREEQLQLVRQQREVERLAQAVIHHMPNGWVAIIDSELRYVFADGQGFDLAGMQPENVVGKTIHEIYPATASGPLQKLIERALAGVRSEQELPYLGNIFRATAVPLENDHGQVIHALLLTQDITELKRVQRELEIRNRQLQELSLTDGLLGIANRRAFDQNLLREWKRAARARQPLALLMIDIDHFKIFNDSYGHTAGDACLQRIAEVLKDVIARPGDVVARYGGEEFAVLLPESELAGALHIADLIHQHLAAAAIPFPDSPSDHCVTASIGAAAMWPDSHQPALALVEAADAALYRAKNEGRNRTASAPSIHDPLDPAPERD